MIASLFDVELAFLCHPVRLLVPLPCRIAQDKLLLWVMLSNQESFLFLTVDSSSTCDRLLLRVTLSNQESFLFLAVDSSSTCDKLLLWVTLSNLESFLFLTVDCSSICDELLLRVTCSKQEGALLLMVASRSSCVPAIEWTMLVRNSHCVSDEQLQCERL